MADFSHLIIDDFVGEPTPTEIEELETLVGAPLPAELLDFLRVANGGYLEYNVEVSGGGKSEIFCFGTIFSTRQPEASAPRSYGRYLFKDEIVSVRRSLGMPQSILPLAIDGGDSLLYLDLLTGNEGVYALVESLPGWTENIMSGRVKVAQSIGDYVSKLRVPEEE